MKFRPVNVILHPADNTSANRYIEAMLGLLLLPLFASPCLAEPVDLGRLFYTPAQRAELETARARKITRLSDTNKPEAPAAPAPRRFDGVVIRSDGQATRWVNGQPEVGPSSVTGLKPGQIRANGKVYEPYQILRPQQSAPLYPATRENTP